MISNSFDREFLGQVSTWNRRAALALAGGATLGFTQGATAATQPALSLDSDSVKLDAFLRATGDVSGAQSVTWAKGSVFAWMPHLGGTHVFDFNLFGVQRLKKTDIGWLRLGKEAGVYTDKASGQPLEYWQNPFTERKVEVVHLKNDPSSGEFRAPPMTSLLADQVCFTRDILQTKPSVMPVDEYPLYSQSNSYKFAELYTYFASAADLADTARPSVPMIGANTRMGNWFPWMEMGQRRGWLLSQVRSKKLNSVKELPREILSYWEKRDPTIFEAPTEVTGPNESSWSFFKKRIDAQRTAAKRGGAL
jgi:Protein of unknown function (DUF1838)